MIFESDIGWVYPAGGHSVNDSTDNYGHPSHRGFQEHIEAKEVLLPDTNIRFLNGTFVRPLLKSWKSNLPECEIYILENAEAVYATPFIRQSFPESTIIFLAAHRVFGQESYNFNYKPFVKSLFRRGERYMDARLIQMLVHRYVDGILSVSEHVKRRVNEFAPQLPKEVVYPYIQTEMANSLSDINPSLDVNHAITVCEARDHKGVDQLVEAWPEVRKEFPDATLDIIGSGHPKKYERVSGVTVRGYVEDLALEYGQASLYIHPARADAFGVTVVEAMRAGVIPIVTQTTGSYPIVSEINEELVVSSTPKDIASGVVDFFKRDRTDRKELSDMATSLADPFVEDIKKNEFESSLRSLLRNISERESSK